MSPCPINSQLDHQCTIFDAFPYLESNVEASSSPHLGFEHASKLPRQRHFLFLAFQILITLSLPCRRVNSCPVRVKGHQLPRTRSSCATSPQVRVHPSLASVSFFECTPANGRRCFPGRLPSLILVLGFILAALGLSAAAAVFPGFPSYLSETEHTTQFCLDGILCEGRERPIGKGGCLCRLMSFDDCVEAGRDWLQPQGGRL